MYWSFLFVHTYFNYSLILSLFIYIIIWFNIEIKFMINKDLIIVVGGITLGI